MEDVYNDPNEIDNGDGNEFGEIEEFGDDADVIVNDYEGQDEDLNVNGDNGDNDEINEEDNDILDGIVEVDFEQKFTTDLNPKYKRTSGIKKVSRYEYSVLNGKLAQYIQQSKITVSEGLLEDPEIKSGDVLRMSRRWIQRREEFPIPINFQRMLFPGNIEKQNPSNLKIDEDFDFNDDHHDTHRFYYNFRKEHYDTSS